MEALPPFYNFFIVNPSTKPPPPLHLTMKPPSTRKTNPPFEKRSSLQGNNSQKKNPEKLESAINTCVSIIKQHWKKMAEVPQERDFLTWSIQNFVGKVKHFVKNIILLD